MFVIRCVSACSRLTLPQVDTHDDNGPREYTGCFEGPEKTLEVGRFRADYSSNLIGVLSIIIILKQ